MLRVEADDSANNLTLKLEGRFAGEEAENTRTLMTRHRHGMRLVVDLTEVTFVDSVGEQVLLFFGQFGAEFVAETSYSLYICERLDLRLAQRWKSDANNSGASLNKRWATHPPRTGTERAKQNRGEGR
jgi:hypothetical protein